MGKGVIPPIPMGYTVNKPEELPTLPKGYSMPESEELKKKEQGQPASSGQLLTGVQESGLETPSSSSKGNWVKEIFSVQAIVPMQDKGVTELIPTGKKVDAIPTVTMGENSWWQKQATKENKKIDPEKYETNLSPGEEVKFNKWLDNNYNAGRIQKGDYDFYKKNGYGLNYDFRAAFKAGENAEVNKTDNEWHWSDIGKKPNHPTFSNQSKYNNVDGFVGGKWDGETFIAPGGKTRDEKLKTIGLNVTFDPLIGTKPAADVDLTKPEAILGASAGAPRFIDLSNPEDISWMADKMEESVAPKPRIGLYDFADVTGSKSKDLIARNEEAAIERKSLKEKQEYKQDVLNELSKYAQKNTTDIILKSRPDGKFTREDILNAGRLYAKQIDPAYDRRNESILKGNEDLGDENKYNLEKTGAAVLMNNVPEEARAQIQALNNETDLAHPKYALAKGWDIVSAYNHIKDNRSTGGWYRTRPSLGQVQRWLDEPELKEMFVGNEVAYEELKNSVQRDIDQIGSNIKAKDVAVGGFLNRTGQAIAGGLESVGNIFDSDAERQKSNLNPTLKRGSFTGNYGLPGQSTALVQQKNSLEEKLKDEGLTPEEQKQYNALVKITEVRDGWDKFADGSGDVTGQVIFQALGTKGVGLATKSLSNAMNISKIPMVVNRGIPAALVAYDPIKKQAVYNFPDDEAKQNIYTGTLLLANIVSEGFFKDEKILPFNAVKKDITETLKRISAKEISKADVKNLITDKMLNYGKNFVKEGNKEAFEEAIVQVVDEMAQATLGAEGYDGENAIRNIGDTYLTTLLNIIPVSALAARSNILSDNFNSVGLYKMSLNPELYKGKVEQMYKDGDMTNDEKNEKIKILNTASLIAANEPPKIAERNTKERAEYLVQVLNHRLRTAELENIQDTNQAKEVKEEIKKSEERATEIYNSEPEEQAAELSEEQKIIQSAIEKGEIKDSLYKGMAEAAVADPEVAKQFIADIKSQSEGEVKGEHGKAESGQRNSFGDSIVDFAIGKNKPEPDLGFDPETNQATSKAESEVNPDWSKDINSTAKELDSETIFLIESNVRMFPVNDKPKSQLIAEAYHSDKAAGKETELTKEVERQLGSQSSQPAEVIPSIEDALKDVESTAKALKRGYNSNEIKIFDNAEKLIPADIKSVSPSERMAEAYHRAKSEKNNPELVKAVESLLGEPTKNETTTKEPAKGGTVAGPTVIMPEEFKPAPIVPLVKQAESGVVQEVAPEKKKLSDRLRAVSSKIQTEGLSSILPDWAKADLPEGTDQAAFGGKALDKAIAKAINIVADALDASSDLAAAIEKGFADLKEYYKDNTKSFNEKRIRADFERNVTAILERVDTQDQQPADQSSKGTNFNFFKNRELSLTGERAEFLSKPTIEAAGKEVSQPFEYTKAELDLMVEDGKRWISEAKQQFNDNGVHYAQKLFKDLRGLRGRMAVKAVGMVNLLNSIDLDLKYKELTNGERDILRNIRRGLELEIAKNAREGSLTLNAQRLIHKLYKGEYKFTEAMEEIVTAPVQKTADDVATKMKAGSSDISGATRKQHRKQSDKKQDSPKKEKKPREKKTTFFEKAVKGMSAEEVAKLKQQITDLANKVKCG